MSKLYKNSFVEYKIVCMPLKILMCCHLPIDPKLGGSKVYIENAKAYENHGHNVTLLGCDELGEKVSHLPLNERIKTFGQVLRDHLQREAHKFDVVEYEYLYQPYPKPEEAKKTLFVARSVLLEHHLLDFHLPQAHGNPFINFLKRIKQRYLLKERLRAADKTISYSDLVNVPNNLDKDRLVLTGVGKDKIIVSPYGSFLNPKVISTKPNKISIGYIATFDPRKGCYDLPQILERLTKDKPDFQLYLYGTKGRFQTKEEVLKHFPKPLHKNLNIKPTFKSEDLDSLLSSIGIGVFPSYLESFGFGLLELTQRGIPCVAYNVPGPSDLLPSHLLVDRGDIKKMSETILKLSSDNEFYLKCQKDCLELSTKFNWSKTVEPALNKYQELLSL